MIGMKSRIVAALTVGLLVLGGFLYRQLPDVGVNERVVVYAASWSPSLLTAQSIRYGTKVPQVVNDGHSPWQYVGTARVGDIVAILVHVMSVPDRFRCSVTVNDHTYSSDNPLFGRRTATSCSVNVTVT